MTSARRRVATLLLAGGVVACAAGSAFFVAQAVGSDEGLPSAPLERRPSVPVARPQAPSPAPALPVPATLADPWLSMRAGPVPVPIELHLPSLGVHAEVLGVGVTERGEMDAPQGGAGDPIWERAYWYRGSAIPGETSTALLAGHASAPQDGPAVFGRLGELHPGDPVTVHDTRTGLDLVFAVTEVALYGRDQAAEPANLARIYGTGPVTGAWSQPSADGVAHMTLITCAGTYRSADGTHDQRLVVYTERVS